MTPAPSETERQAEQAVLQAALQHGFLDSSQVAAARAWQRERPQERRILPRLASHLPAEQLNVLRGVYQQALAAPDVDSESVADHGSDAIDDADRSEAGSAGHLQCSGIDRLRRSAPGFKGQGRSAAQVFEEAIHGPDLLPQSCCTPSMM